MTAAPPATDPAPPPAFDLADPGVLLRLRRLFDTDLLGIFFFGYDGAITAANDAFLRSVGYDRGDLAAGRVDWAAMTPPEYAAQDAAKAAEVKARGRCVPFEKVYLHRDGRPVPVLIGAVEADADGGVCFVLDLTERKRLERERRESDRLHRFALDAAGLGTWDFDVVTEEVVWDARCRAMFGLGDDGGVTGGDGGEPRSAGPTTLSDPLNFIHPDDLAAVRGRIAAAVAPASDGKYETQYRTVGPDGRLRWVRAVGRAACEGEGAERRAARLRGVLEDVTARRAADEAARRREAEVRALFQCAAFGMVELDARGGRVVRANDAFCAILGRPFEELEGRPVADFTHPDDRGTVRETFAALAAGRSATLDFEQRYERPDGSAVWAAVSASAVRQDGGPVRRVFAVVRNVTVRIRAAAAAAMLAEAGTALAAGPDLETALAAAAGAAVPAFADWCAVDLAPRPDPDAEGRPAGGEQEGGAAAGLRRVAVAPRGPGEAATGRTAPRRLSPGPRRTVRRPRGLPHRRARTRPGDRRRPAGRRGPDRGPPRRPAGIGVEVVHLRPAAAGRGRAGQRGPHPRRRRGRPAVRRNRPGGRLGTGPPHGTGDRERPAAGRPGRQRGPLPRDVRERRRRRRPRRLGRPLAAGQPAAVRDRRADWGGVAGEDVSGHHPPRRPPERLGLIRPPAGRPDRAVHDPQAVLSGGRGDRLDPADGRLAAGGGRGGAVRDLRDRRTSRSGSASRGACGTPTSGWRGGTRRWN